MAGGKQKYSVVETGNIGFGQVGSVFINGTAASSPPTDSVFVAITFLEDTTFNSTNGLKAEDEDQYFNTDAAAHNESDGSETTTQGSGGIEVASTDTFPQGATIFGRWTEILLATGAVVAYIG
tara:strand:+ start:51 stop:419 length:369 start_codon:yes stop_codon:yes gene_type:complete